MSGGKILDKIEIDLRSDHNDVHTIYLDIYDNSLSRKWLVALNHLLCNNYHLEKNYCWFGFVEHKRDGAFILDQVNRSISAINDADLGYRIDDYFDMENTIDHSPRGISQLGRNIRHEKFNQLHRYFEDLQGVSGRMSPYYELADARTRWHIRQLNLLCHEFESWVLSWKKQIAAPEWQRPSQLMCWLNAPRFQLESDDYDLFGIETLNRPMGGLFVGVNKAVGKHHWEVFNDEGRDSRLGELTTTTLKNQTEAAGDFDIEWARDPSTFEWQQIKLQEFREWLIANGVDPEDRSLTIGHPQIGQVDLDRSFGSSNQWTIWTILNNHLDVFKIRTSECQAIYDYRWSDVDFIDQQVKIIQQGNKSCHG